MKKNQVLLVHALTASQYPNAFQQISPALYTSLATTAFNNAVAQYNEMVQRLGNIRVAGIGFSSMGFNLKTCLETNNLTQYTWPQAIFSKALRTHWVCRSLLKISLRPTSYASLPISKPAFRFNDSPIMDDSKNPKSPGANEKDILVPSVDNHWGIFVDGNGIFANVNINNQLPGYNVQSGGVTFGGDYKWNETFSTGIYAGYEGSQSKQSEGTSVIDNGSRFGVFGTYQRGGLFANAIAGGDSHS